VKGSGREAERSTEASLRGARREAQRWDEQGREEVRPSPTPPSTSPGRGASVPCRCAGPGGSVQGSDQGWEGYCKPQLRTLFSLGKPRNGLPWPRSCWSVRLFRNTDEPLTAQRKESLGQPRSCGVISEIVPVSNRASDDLIAAARQTRETLFGGTSSQRRRQQRRETILIRPHLPRRAAREIDKQTPIPAQRRVLPHRQLPTDLDHEAVQCSTRSDLSLECRA